VKALRPTSDPRAGVELRDTDSNLDLHVQSVGVVPAERPRTDAPSRPPSSPREARARRSGGHPTARMARPPYAADDVFHATRLPFDPGSPSGGCASAPEDVLRGGALEPDPSARLPKCAG